MRRTHVPLHRSTVAAALSAVLLPIVLWSCSDGPGGPLPPVCVKSPAAIDLDQTLRPLEGDDDIVYFRNISIENRVERCSSGGNLSLPGTLSVALDQAAPIPPEIYVVPSRGDTLFDLPARTHTAFRVAFRVTPETTPLRYTGEIGRVLLFRSEAAPG